MKSEGDDEMNYRHLDFEERERLYGLKAQGCLCAIIPDS